MLKMDNRKKDFGRRELMPFDDVVDTILGSIRTLGSEEVDLADASGRILAADIISDIDMPPFDKSAMDGFACRSADLGGPLRIVETALSASLFGSGRRIRTTVTVSSRLHWL